MVGRPVGLERHNSPQQDRASQEAWERQEQTGRDVGPIVEAYREKMSLVGAVLVYDGGILYPVKSSPSIGCNCPYESFVCRRRDLRAHGASVLVSEAASLTYI